MANNKCFHRWVEKRLYGGILREHAMICESCGQKMTGRGISISNPDRYSEIEAKFDALKEKDANAEPYTADRRRHQAPH